MWRSYGKVSWWVQEPLRATSVHTQGAGDTAKGVAGVCGDVGVRVLHAVSAASGGVGGGGETPSEPRESPGSSLPRQRSPDGNVLLHCGLPPVPREQPPLPLESGPERDRSSGMPPSQRYQIHHPQICRHHFTHRSLHSFRTPPMHPPQEGP